mmetsp:Transcript_18150/g.50806  ORF Transcript_18150/g.50806 Transcript_18150/m.50806 type:complete len:214 (-) Transcript_18150:3329-3970(-)
MKFVIVVVLLLRIAVVHVVAVPVDRPALVVVVLFLFRPDAVHHLVHDVLKAAATISLCKLALRALPLIRLPQAGGQALRLRARLRVHLHGSVSGLLARRLARGGSRLSNCNNRAAAARRRSSCVGASGLPVRLGGSRGRGSGGRGSRCIDHAGPALREDGAAREHLEGLEDSGDDLGGARVVQVHQIHDLGERPHHAGLPHDAHHLAGQAGAE